jgi:hypothetical protein
MDIDMEYSFSKNLHDSDGDIYEECLLVFIGDNTIVKFSDADELESFANKILGSMKEIRESY